MSTPVKKAPAKKSTVKRSPRAAAKPPADVDATTPEITEEELAALADGQGDEELAPGEIRPVIIGKRGRRGDTPVEMVTLFELNDVPYQIPRNPSAALVLSWIMDVRKYGTNEASQRVGLTLLGEESLRALSASAEVEPEDLYEIFENIGVVFFTSENYAKITAASDPS